MRTADASHAAQHVTAAADRTLTQEAACPRKRGPRPSQTVHKTVVFQSRNYQAQNTSNQPENCTKTPSKKLCAINPCAPNLLNIQPQGGQIMRWYHSSQDGLPQHPNAEIKMMVVTKTREIPGVRTGQATRRYPQISSLPDSLRGTHLRARPPHGIMLGLKGTAAAGESYGFHFDKLNAPSGQILIKTAGIGEHLPHVSDLTRVPVTNILIKSRRTIEHVPHVSDLTRVPVTNILIKSRSTFEHTPHASDLTRVPATNILIESRSTIEHVPHAGDLTRVPRPYGSVELRSAFEHPAHTHDRIRIPAVKILVEGTRITEHALHRCDRAGIPAADILIERTRTIEHSAHR